MHSDNLEGALQTWASSERHALNLGFPVSSSGFSEYYTGNWNDKQNARTPSESDLDVLSIVERGIGKMRVMGRAEAVWIVALVCLTESYGAYPEAHFDREVRMERLFAKYNKREVYHALDRGRVYLQGAIDTYLG